MLINKKVVFAVAAGLAISASSCKKFMDVNTNPNVSQTVTVQTLLPAAELYIGTSMGTDLEISGSIWAQFWTQTPAGNQYVAFEQYAPAQAAFQNSWNNLYEGAENFYQLYNLADSQHKKQYQAISLLMRAYTFQVITDGWGDVPFKQALKGEYSNGHLVSPKYDTQSVIYTGIIALIDTANTLIKTSDPVVPGADDLIYGGDMTKWQKFSNTLKLRVLLRMAYSNPTGAQTMISAFLATSPKFIGEGDDAKISYGYNSSNKNPLYAEESSTTLAGIQNLGGSKTCIDSMNSNFDPRKNIFYEAGTGITQGTYNLPIAAGTYAIPNVYVAGDAMNSASTNAPVNLLTSWESYFLQAEVAARGWGMTTASDDSLFYWGIKASFDYPFYANALAATYKPATSSAYNDYVISGGYWTVYPATGSLAQKI